MHALVAEQQSNESLTGLLAMAKQNKGDFFLQNGLLYHRDQVFG